MKNDIITLYASEKNWIEGEAVRQLESVAALPGMKRAAGYPDLHPGKYGPVGAAMLSEGVLYPTLVGSDAGCSIALFRTDIKSSNAKPEKWSKKVSGLETPWEGDGKAWLEQFGADPALNSDSLGTIGYGNHFAELQQVKEIVDKELFEASGLHTKEVTLLVHSGSRGIGETLLRRHIEQFRDYGLSYAENRAALEQYLAGHDAACIWAKASRALIAERLFQQLGCAGLLICDQVHNSVSRKTIADQEFFLHRKGATPTDSGAVMIPGSRGSLSYLVMPTGPQEANLWSVAHGAGRKWARGECEGRLKKKYSIEALQRTKLGSFVICEDRDLIWEEAPESYKNIDQVIGDMAEAGLIAVIATFSPLLTYKTRRRQ